MALRFNNHIFYHIPKCGGSYVRRVIEQIEPDRQEICWTHATPFEVRYSMDTSPVSFASVRHPVSWYESYFRYRISGMKPWVMDCYFDKQVAATNYERFIENVMCHTIAGATTYFGHLVAPFFKQVDHLLKMENLNEELGELLQSYGYRYTPIPPVKVSPKNINTRLPKEVYYRLVKREAPISLALGYEAYPPSVPVTE
ncbi:MAG: hypothetical protein ACYSOO_09935 [Planctomycetota bacterium]|jgi:hypothetical protein